MLDHRFTAARKNCCLKKDYNRVGSFLIRSFFDALVKFKQISPYQASVYKALLSYRGKSGCFPSHATIAFEAGVCERTVRKSLKEARLRGWIDWTNHRHGRRQSSNRYVFLLTSEYINKILNEFSKLKKKTREISAFFRRHLLPGSPYFYIKKELKQRWKKTEQPSDALSPFQRLFQENPEEALRQFLAQ